MKMHWFLILLMGCLGCSGGSANTTAISETDHELGLAAYEKKDYEEAVRRLDLAIKRGGINADMIAEALLKKARSNTELGRLDDALRDLEVLQKESPALDEVLAAKGALFVKKGDLQEAKRLYAEARSLNPRHEFPSELK